MQISVPALLMKCLLIITNIWWGVDIIFFHDGKLLMKGAVLLRGVSLQDFPQAYLIDLKPFCKVFFAS